MERIKNNADKFIAFILPIFISAFAIAQEKVADVNVEVEGGGGAWYANPVVWVIGAAIFILLLVAMLKNNKI